jgi:dTDP-4-amino-4,6-dideoxygalactose transaminase
MASSATSAKETVAHASRSGEQVAPPALSFEFLDLKAQFATIREDVMCAIAAVMESQQFILGREVRLFEEEAAAALGARHAVACASGSDALVLAMLALGIGSGDEVITSPFTFFATAGSIARVGARPAFVDIDPETYNIDLVRLETAITPRTRAIMPVHLFGLPTAMDTVSRIARTEGLAIIEDAAQAIGARCGDRSVGTFGEFGCFSFFPSKNLGGAGDGGLITTQDGDLAERIRILRVHGSKQKYHHQLLGLNSRLDALQAAILRVKLPHLQKWTDERRLRAERYRTLLEEADLTHRIALPSALPNECFHVYNQFVVRAVERDALRGFLRENGIPTEIYYPTPLHLQPAFSYLGYHAGEFPHAEKASREALALPIYPELTERQQEAVVGAISSYYSRPL